MRVGTRNVPRCAIRSVQATRAGGRAVCNNGAGKGEQEAGGNATKFSTRYVPGCAIRSAPKPRTGGRQGSSGQAGGRRRAALCGQTLLESACHSPTRQHTDWLPGIADHGPPLPHVQLPRPGSFHARWTARRTPPLGGWPWQCMHALRAVGRAGRAAWQPKVRGQGRAGSLAAFNS